MSKCYLVILAGFLLAIVFPLGLTGEVKAFLNPPFSSNQGTTTNCRRDWRGSVQCEQRSSGIRIKDLDFETPIIQEPQPREFETRCRTEANGDYVCRQRPIY
jgi:hypothetical protein